MIDETLSNLDPDSVEFFEKTDFKDPGNRRKYLDADQSQSEPYCKAL